MIKQQELDFNDIISKRITGNNRKLFSLPMSDELSTKHNFFELYPFDGGGGLIFRQMLDTIDDREISEHILERKRLSDWGLLPKLDFRKFDRWGDIEKSCWINRFYFVASLGRAYCQAQKDLFTYSVDLDKRVRADNPLRTITEQIDFTFVRQEVGGCYGYNGNVSVDPAVIMKLMFLLFYDDVALLNNIPTFCRMLSGKILPSQEQITFFYKRRKHSSPATFRQTQGRQAQGFLLRETATAGQDGGQVGEKARPARLNCVSPACGGLATH